ncbi:hypothetical protein [Hydrogenophaga palleronii]|uniref:hypothetical protein n=1 Tax=Hydrogenophaga palleronii TaxID=65655 RepID=UPI000825324D|nr:hypothetical protein [Hydrogenophaga palleronii]
MNDEPELNTPAYPAVVALIRHARAWTWGASLAVLVVFGWLAWRTGWPELLLAGPFAAWVLHFVVRVAVDVVSLVADTLMPR